MNSLIHVMRAFKAGTLHRSLEDTARYVHFKKIVLESFASMDDFVCFRYLDRTLFFRPTSRDLLLSLPAPQEHYVLGAL